MTQEIKLLNAESAQRILKRMAYEIYENNADKKELLLIGIKERGYDIATLLQMQLAEICSLNIQVLGLHIDKENPLHPVLDESVDISKKVVIVVDDVTNSGKTILYALKTLLHQIPEKLQVAVLIDRKHKQFPISPDYTGMQISTTIKDHIKVNVQHKQVVSAVLV